MDKEGNKHLKKLKRIKILDEFLMFFGKNKIGFKFPEDKEHFTIKFLTEGMVDFHETIEGKEKKYPRTGKLNLRKFAETFRETLYKELPKILEEIDINDPKYESVNVIICPTKETTRRAIESIEVRKKEIKIEKNKFYDMVSSVPMKDLPNYDFQVAFWVKEGDEYTLYRIEGKYFVLKANDFMALLDKILEKSNIQLRNVEKL
jgi:hypothetical protein